MGCERSVYQNLVKKKDGFQMKCVLEFVKKKMGFGRSVYQNLEKKWVLDEVCIRIWPNKKKTNKKEKKNIFRPLSESLTRFTINASSNGGLGPRLQPTLKSADVGSTYKYSIFHIGHFFPRNEKSEGKFDLDLQFPKGLITPKHL